MSGPLPFLDLTAEGFSTRSPEVLAAREAHWCAQTPFGLAVLRHREAGQLLRDRRLRQGSHAWPETMGLTGSFARFWSDSVIGQEGAAHKALRLAAQTALAPNWIARLVPQFEATATRLAEALPDPCEFIADFTEPFAGRAITTLLGLPETEAEWIAQDAVRLGLAMGLDAKAHEQLFNSATDRLMDLARQMVARARKTPSDDYVTRLMAAGNQLSDQQILDLVVISIFGGVDTTRAQLGFALALLAEHPAQWIALRADPGLIPGAIEEAIRARPTTTWSTREATEDFELSGVPIPKGTTLHILAHATATDPRANTGWQFDVTVKRKAHFGFGGGAHHCLGQFVARTDMAAALRVLVGRFSEVAFAAQPEWLPETGNTSPARLPLRFTE
ncbi:putative cytochrome P450 hydroxylase [Candidatus Rhodobacter oscarellae]|uniref:Putative cytochrome P450 hydroxylase n=1 Tax=Candidatus Rhodobacter oscarellae TaxID=1675527 RepID=A0A0J9E4R1_9RHOB|nr:cytochrome P450 [Candidatus Rhodobacter lobularis]KMW57780.1 putative cytochrome P450 hydroxylase [Candidatus Rhodobacter lobularis]